jgi:quercetin dioxygenase-like cupin family protein
MNFWNLRELPVRAHHPEVLVSTPEGRAIALELPAGDRLQEHQVHERGWLLVLDGEIEIVDHDGTPTVGGSGLLAHFDPNERREVRARQDSRLLLLLTPWPGHGHPSEVEALRSDQLHDEALEDSFPSSDPPAASAGVGGQ